MSWRGRWVGVAAATLLGASGALAQDAAGTVAPESVATAAGAPAAAATPQGASAPAGESAMVAAVAAAGTPTPGAAGSAAVLRYNRWRGYMHDLFGPGALIGVGVSAGIDQWQKSPPQWGTGGSGFGKRVASRYGELAAQVTVRDGLAAALGRNPEYRPCHCSDFGGRLNNALIESVTDINQSGHRVLSVPRIAGSFAGGYAPLLWRPDLTVSQATRDGALGLLWSAAGNLVSEYVHFGGPSNPPVVARRHRQ